MDEDAVAVANVGGGALDKLTEGERERGDSQVEKPLYSLGPGNIDSE